MEFPFHDIDMLPTREGVPEQPNSVLPVASVIEQFDGVQFVPVLGQVKLPDEVLKKHTAAALALMGEVPLLRNLPEITSFCWGIAGIDASIMTTANKMFLTFQLPFGIYAENSWTAIRGRVFRGVFLL
jgi:hypothetical protein